MDLNKRIYVYLQEIHPRGATAKTIAFALNQLKSTVNKALYSALSLDGCIRSDKGTPPQWYYNASVPEARGNSNEAPSQITYVLIDLDNCPLLEQSRHYASDNMCIYGYCSPVYNHWVPAENTPTLRLWRAQQTQKDAAEIQMTIEATQLVLASKASVDFILVSKDRSVETLQTLLKQNFNVPVELCRTWEQLRIYLE